LFFLQVFEQAFTVTGKANSMLHTSLEPEEIDRYPGLGQICNVLASKE